MRKVGPTSAPKNFPRSGSRSNRLYKRLLSESPPMLLTERVSHLIEKASSIATSFRTSDPGVRADGKREVGSNASAPVLLDNNTSLHLLAPDARKLSTHRVPMWSSIIRAGD